MKFWHLGIISLVLFVTACAKQEPAVVTAHEETPDTALTEMDATPAATPDPYATDPYARDTAPRAQDNRMTEFGGRETKLIAAGGETRGGRTHTVQKGDTLYSLARQYYNDQSKWKRIWEANRDRVPNRDRLAVGTQLTIP